MKLESAFLAEHVAAYDKKLNMLGGLVRELLILDGYQNPYLGWSLVLVLDLSDEPLLAAEDQPRIRFRMVCYSPDGMEFNPVKGDGQINLKAGVQSFIFWPLTLALPTLSGTYRVVVSTEDGQAVSTTFEVIDMRRVQGS